MKIAISLPDDLFERGEALAARLGISRSQLYRDALAQYVRWRDPETITAALNAVADDLAEDAQWVAASAAQVLERVEW